MKYIGIFIFVSLSLLSCKKKRERAKKTVLKKISYKMSAKTLISNKFETDNDPFNYYKLEFFKKNKYKFEFLSEGGESKEIGTYKIKKKKVFLKPKNKCSKNLDCEEEYLGKANCKISQQPYNIYFSHWLICKSVNVGASGEMSQWKFSFLTSKVKAGLLKKHNKLMVHTMGYIGGITTAALNLRLKPHIRAARLSYYKTESEAYQVDDTKRSIPKKTHLKVLARTTKKTKVKKWNNYWYLIKTQYNEGWVFGRFIKLTKK